MTDFLRARTEEQRAVRRDAILDVARRLVVEEGLSGVSLNEIAREVGLAKSNVLRYFESREAILLTLLGHEYADWVHAVGTTLPFSDEADPAMRVSAAIASTILERPLLCELLAAAPTVLEQNLSAQVALDHKGRMVAASRDLLTACTPVLGALDHEQSRAFLVAMHAFIGLVWATQRPSPGMAAAVEQNPELRSFSVDPEIALRELLFTFLVGIATRPPLDVPPCG